ncbi:hypothetical protein [Bacillus weihaiensis]|uniref:Uncharacterized protein n=1 Tax=Bacillus weihaiensis TaxID=1547283 RepID=A0A1L3MR27_9BACI|nr:hypothetical protein [Bacillus weihaiensis]APH04771.1 hypothetical protein A9C19_08440 [Bacillus weihaiensis]
MIFYACVSSDKELLKSYKGIEVSVLGQPSEIVARFESYDPLEDYHNFVSWAEGVGEDNVGYCDSLKRYAEEYKKVSKEDSVKMISMIYGSHDIC